MRIAKNLYSILEVNSKPYLVAKGDLIIIDKQLKIGDRVKFDRIREVGNEDFKLVGNPYSVNVDVYGTIMEHIERQHETFYQKRSGRSTRKVNKSMHSIVRISDITLNKELI